MTNVFPLLFLIAMGHGHQYEYTLSIKKGPIYKGNQFNDLSSVEKENDIQQPSHFVRTPTDDEDLDLIRKYSHGKLFDKTGQLRYASVPVIEKELVNDILNVIFNRKEYISLLNKPKRKEMIEVIREMLRIPTQKVLKQQILHKILASRAWYEKSIKPMLEDNNREYLMKFAQHLLDAHENGTLSTADALEFNKRFQNIAFFDRPDDRQFRGLINKLQKVFGKSMNIIEDDKKVSWVPDTELRNMTSSEENVDDDFSPVSSPAVVTKPVPTRNDDIVHNSQTTTVPSRTIAPIFDAAFKFLRAEINDSTIDVTTNDESRSTIDHDETISLSFTTTVQPAATTEYSTEKGFTTPANAILTSDTLRSSSPSSESFTEYLRTTKSDASVDDISVDYARRTTGNKSNYSLPTTEQSSSVSYGSKSDNNSLTSNNYSENPVGTYPSVEQETTVTTNLEHTPGKFDPIYIPLPKKATKKTSATTDVFEAQGSVTTPESNVPSISHQTSNETVTTAAGIIQTSTAERESQNSTVNYNDQSNKGASSFLKPMD